MGIIHQVSLTLRNHIGGVKLTFSELPGNDASMREQLPMSENHADQSTIPTSTGNFLPPPNIFLGHEHATEPQGSFPNFEAPLESSHDNILLMTDIDFSGPLLDVTFLDFIDLYENHGMHQD